MNANNYEEIYVINQYFGKFVLQHIGSFDEIALKIAKQIENNHNAPFDSDWNYLMTLVQLIENRYCTNGFESADNYFGFHTETCQNIQDKGETKMDAIYSCCHRALKEFWKDEPAPFFPRGCEPFDKEDFPSDFKK